ncbi:MAG: BREX-4 system phosphatase PglZ [Selenomonadaceae bacterium]|nr:BREX-4 system phosphatase PglZ [Selenomonadaceae bacterium]
MIVFKNLEELKKNLTQDKKQKTLSPVRFINVDSISMWHEVKNFLATEKFIFLSEFCSAEDTMPNLKRFYTALKNETKNCCVLPLSEFLRVRPEIAESEIKKILNSFFQEPTNFRIYFLMYRLKSVLKSLEIYDVRKKNCIILLDTAEENNYSLTIIQKSLNLKLQGTRADGFKNYLKYWEEKPKESLHVYTNNAIYLQDQKFFDDVKVISDAFSLLRYHYNLPVELEKNFGSREDWEKLAVSVTKTGNLEKAFRYELNTDSFKPSLFSNFHLQENFQRWLLWLWCKIGNENFYADSCAKKSDSPKNWIEQIYIQIFDSNKNFSKVYDERREILSCLQVSLPEKFVDKIRQADKKLALKILTDTSVNEKILFFEVIRKFKFTNYDEVVAVLQKNFPALANYLSDSNGIFSTEQRAYFRKYRWLKVTNILSEDFYNLVNEIAENNSQNIYSLKSRNQLVAEEYFEDAAIFFVDALGVEYLNFLARIFSSPEFKNFTIKYQFGYCNLPSITEYNKDFLNDKNIAAEILDLDKIKHSTKKYPENILAELNFLSALKEKILTTLKNYKKIIVSADHGASRLAVLVRKTKFDKNFESKAREVFYGGRFANSLSGDKEKFSNFIEQNDKIIFADYSRFIQQGGAGNEIHGGATLEEWLVPVITIERTEKIISSNKSSAMPNKKRGIMANKNFDI